MPTPAILARSGSQGNGGACHFAETRLIRFASQGFNAEVERLGGKLIIEHVREAHRNYGEALGITVEGQDPNSIEIRESLQTFITTLRANKPSAK